MKNNYVIRKCVNCSQDKKFIIKCRWYKVKSGYNINKYLECLTCGVEKDLPTNVSELSFYRNKLAINRQRSNENGK